MIIFSKHQIYIEMVHLPIVYKIPYRRAWSSGCIGRVRALEQRYLAYTFTGKIVGVNDHENLYTRYPIVALGLLSL